jgi:hypothetical protein
MDQKMDTADGTAAMGQRFQDVEPTFAQIKQAILRQQAFLLRGIQKAAGKFTLCCTAHTPKKIKKYLLSNKNNYNIKSIANIIIKKAA